MSHKKKALTVGGLSGQQRVVAKALLDYGYIDKEYALVKLKIRSLPEIVRRLRAKGWPIKTNDETPSRLYTLSRNVKKDARLLTTAVNAALSAGQVDAALAGAKSLVKRIEQEQLDVNDL